MRRMRARTLMMAVLVLHLLPLAVVVPDAVTTPQLNYRCLVNEEGLANISAVFRDPRSLSSTYFWMLVPKNASEYETNVVAGEIVSQQVLSAKTSSDDEYVFYSNLTIQYSSPFELNVSWNMSYTSLTVEPNALFFSPAIGFSPSVHTEFTVVLPNSMSSISQMSHVPISRSGSTLVFEPQSEDRIAIAYTVSGSGQSVRMQSAHFRFDVPKRYEDIGRRLDDFYENASQVLNTLFNMSLTSVNVEFFVPSTLDEISTGGFVPIESAYRVGTINLNIFYVRTEKGYLEAIAAHELVHHYLAASGVAPDVLWFHEGMANYVGIKVSELGGMGGASMAQDLVDEASALPSESQTFVLSWTVDQTDSRYTLYQHYAAAYYLVSTLTDQLSSPDDTIIKGQKFFTSLFTKIRQLPAGVSNNGQLAETMYAAANFSEAAYLALASIGLKVKPVFVSPGGQISSPESLGANLIYLLLQDPLDSAIEQAAAEDTSTALTLMNEANDLIANFDVSVSVLLVLLVMATVVLGLQRLERHPELPPI